MNFKKTIINLASLAVLTAFMPSYEALADSCTECHKNPKYKKEDINVLKPCLECHGVEGHPYKEAKNDKKNFTKEYPHPSKNADTSKMVLIPQGDFLMGTDLRHDDEGPKHTSYTDSFYADIYEVTNSDYKSFIDKTKSGDQSGHRAPDHWIGGSYPKGHEKHPVVFVSWFDANSYCRWNGKRLLTEREWEKAARGLDGQTYPWGDDWDMSKSNNPVKESTGTEPVGSYEEGKSPFGLYDMSGNVWEWVDEHYYPHPGSSNLSPEFGDKYRLLKGGSWWDCMFYSCGISAPTYNRSFFDPTTKNQSFGFRCGADVSSSSDSK